MIGRTNAGGGGGGGLNYKVVGGTTEPGNPRENTIWVKTDVKIESHTFSENEPNSPAEGMVWIRVGKTSTVGFNALKKNCIVILPVAVSQYADGSWVPLDAYIYQGGWVHFANAILYLFNKGDLCEGVSGGWVATDRHVHPTNPRTPTLTFNGESMTVSYNSNRNFAGGTVETVNEIDLSSFSKLTFNVTAVTNKSGQTSEANQDCGISIGVMDTTQMLYDYAASNAPRVGENVIDVSAIEGAHKICINVISSTGLVSVTVDSIHLE